MVDMVEAFEVVSLQTLKMNMIPQYTSRSHFSYHAGPLSCPTTSMASTVVCWRTMYVQRSLYRLSGGQDMACGELG